MGMPSATIYSHELITGYGVRTLIRVGSCGALSGSLRLRDLVAAIGASTDSAMNRVRFDGLVDYAPVADFQLLRDAVDVAAGRGTELRVGPILATDAFYHARPDLCQKLAGYGVLAVEMESAALYTTAAELGARALSILTVSDIIGTGERLSAEDRERSFAQMVEIALETAVRADPS
jgi:purine-nucleoside phosphorylase